MNKETSTLRVIKKIFYIFVLYILQINLVLADGWILWNFKWTWSWAAEETTKALREWDIHIEDIPLILKWAINFFMWLAWTVAIIFIIIWAYQILFGSLEQDKTKWKNTIIMALWWFALASLAWLIIKFLLDNLS